MLALHHKEKYYFSEIFGINSSPCREEIGARASIRTCAFARMSDCSYLFGIARAIQDLSIRTTEFLFAEGRKMFHLGQSRVKQSYESKRWQSLVLQLRQWRSYLACAIAWLIVKLARAIFCPCVDMRTWDRTCLRTWTVTVPWKP